MIENQEIHEVKHQQQQPLQLPPLSSQQQWNTIQSDYNDGPTSMEVNTSEMQPLSLPTNIQATYDPNAQYMRNIDESVQYQQSQQDYWSQQLYQNNYGRNESMQSNWQQQSTPVYTLTDQTEVTNSQQQDKWNYEVY